MKGEHMGRKNAKPIFVYLSDEDYNYLKNRAKEECSTVADQIRRLIAQDRNNSENTQ